MGGLTTTLTGAGSRLWVGVSAGEASHRGGTLTIATQMDPVSAGAGPSRTPDPASYNEAFAPQYMGLAYDGLVTFDHSDGTAGTQLVPDLAVSLPRPTGGGVTYTFNIRPGLRYSDGRPVVAGDFRRAIERLFAVHSPGAPFFVELRGGPACARAPETCDLSGGISTDDARGTVRFHLLRPDPDFLFKLTVQEFAAPIPAGTPDHEPPGIAVPGTGPYRISDAGPRQVRFTRNRYFREWSHAAQPAGNPAQVVWRRMSSADAAVSSVQRGDADWFFGLIPPDRYRNLALTVPSQLHASPTYGVEFIPLNTHLAPFNDVRVRRAVNFAIDRGHIAKLYGGRAFARPLCQPLAPGLPGYRRYCPYTREPAASGTWSGPNLSRARALVAASGTRGETIDVWGSPDEGYVPPSVPRYVAALLRSLGYRVRLHMVPFASISPAMRRHFQLSVDGDWLAEYPAASAYLPQFFGCGGGTSNGYVCEPPVDRAMSDASRLELDAPRAADTAWAQIDRRLTDDALWVPTVSEHQIEVTSARLRNYEYNPVWGFLADQVWLR